MTPDSHFPAFSYAAAHVSQKRVKWSVPPEVEARTHPAVLSSRLLNINTLIKADLKSIQE
jgi:hypothetical protein